VFCSAAFLIVSRHGGFKNSKDLCLYKKSMSKHFDRKATEKILGFFYEQTAFFGRLFLYLFLAFFGIFPRRRLKKSKTKYRPKNRDPSKTSG
jgi:hypothetical protein